MIHYKKPKPLTNATFLSPLTTVTFKDTFSLKKSSWEVIQAMARLHNDLITIRSAQEDATQFRTTIRILDNSYFAGVAKSELEAKNFAATNAVQFLMDLVV